MLLQSYPRDPVRGVLPLAAAALADAVLLVGGRTQHHYAALVAGAFSLAETRSTTVRVAGRDTDIHFEIR